MLLTLNSSKKYAKEYYSDAGDIDGATDISVTAGATTPNINAVLALAPPSIQGTVTEDGTGAPVPQCTVSASNAGTWIQSLTDVNGHYVISGLPDGDYRVFFQCGETYRNEFHNDAIDYDSATLVSVSSTTAPIIIDAGVSRFTSFVTGTVTDEITGIPLGGRYVSSHFQGAGWLNDYTWTDVCGNYHLGVVSGSNDIYFSGGNHNDAEFFDNAGNPDDALLVTVAANQTASNINAALSPDSTSITGWIKGPAGAPLTANISAAQLEGSTWVTKAQVSSDPQTGYYAFPDLPEGKYRIKFESNNYDIEVWDKGDGATDYSQGKDVVVWKEDYFSQGGINATLMHKDVTSECIAGDDLNLTGFTVGTHDRTTTGMLATSPNAVVPEGAIVKLTAGSGIGFGKPFSVHNTGMLQAIVAPGISCP